MGGDDVLVRGELVSAVHDIRGHTDDVISRELQDCPSCDCDVRLEQILAHDAALRKRLDGLEAKLHMAGRALDTLDDADWERLCEAVSWNDPDGFDVLDELAADARARQSLDDDEGYQGDHKVRLCPYRTTHSTSPDRFKTVCSCGWESPVVNYRHTALSLHAEHSPDVRCSSDLEPDDG